METRQSKKGRDEKKHNPHSEDFVVDRVALDDITDSVVDVEFLWKQRPGVEGMKALPPVALQIPGKNSCFSVSKATDRQHVNPESLVLALTQLRDFLIARGVTSLSLPVYDPNKGKLHPRELYALLHEFFWKQT